jgi:hypothetical protein
MPPPELLRTSNVDSSHHIIFPAAHANHTSVLSDPTLGRASAKREIFSAAAKNSVKSEPRSQSPPQTMAPAAPERNYTLRTSPASARTTPKPINPFISGMVDNTQYPSAPNRSPSVPRSTTTSDEQVAKKFATSIAGFPVTAIDTEQRRTSHQLNGFFVPDPAFVTTSARNIEEPRVRQDDVVEARVAEVTAHSPGTLPKATNSAIHASQAISSSPGTPKPRTDRQPTSNPRVTKLDNAKFTTPHSLYPGPSATKSSLDLNASTIAKKRQCISHSDHPERFQYAGSTFSNLDDVTFHKNAASNPYLSQLTSDASRPVYKTAKEARYALKEAEKPPVPPVAPVDYNQQIKELIANITDFRKKYKKSKHMTTQAGIQVAGNVWDRLSNIVQYPPDFDEYAQNEPGDIEKYAKDMKAWDKAIGHQVIIKKRIVYREAIEKLQVKLDILQAEKDMDSHHTKLKRKANDAADDDGEDDG